MEAARNSLEAGLGLATALCATKEFISNENLLHYAEFVKLLGASFIWLIEPRAEGRYKGQDIALRKEHYAQLDHFYLTLNSSREFRDYPRILFPNYNHRRVGCAGAGTSNILIDSDGYINPCPFCREQVVHSLDCNSEKSVKQMIEKGCFKFDQRQLQV